MDKSFEIGKFDLDIALRDAALDELNRPTRRMLANASIGMDAMDAYYAAQELFEAVKGVFRRRRTKGQGEAGSGSFLPVRRLSAVFVLRCCWSRYYPCPRRS